MRIKILICLSFILSFSQAQNTQRDFEDSVMTVFKNPSIKEPNRKIHDAIEHPLTSDSLELKLYELRFGIMDKKEIHDLAVKALVDQGIMLEYLGADSEQILRKLREAQDYSIQHDDTTNLVWATIRISKHYLNNGQLNTTEELEATTFLINNLDRKMDKEVAMLGYNHLAKRQLRFYDFKTALKYSTHSYELAYTSRFKHNAIDIAGSIFIVKNQYRDTTAVSSFVKEVEAIPVKDRSKHFVPFYLTLADLENLFDLNAREAYRERALELLQQSPDEDQNIKVLYISSKHLVEKANAQKLKETLSVFKASLESTPPSHKYYYPSQIELLEGQYYLLIQKQDEAIAHFHKSLAEAKRIDAPLLFAPIYKLLYQTYYQVGDYEAAFKYLDAYNTQEDKVFSLNKVGEIESLIIEYETQKKQQTINNLKVKQTLSNQITEAKTIANRRLQLFLIVLSALTIILVYLYIQNRLKSGKLDKLNRLKDVTFSVLSHDLRSPLNTFKSLLAISDRRELSSDDYKKYLDVIKYEVNNTSEFLETILQWSQANQGLISIQKQTVNLGKVISDIESICQTTFKVKEINLIISEVENSVAYTDEALISFILRNLLFNAYKFSPKGSTIKVTTKDTPEAIRINIIDKGLGMSPTQVEHFYKGDLNAGLDSTGEKSTGIGLMLCRDFAEKLNISLQVKSQVNSGTTFSLVIPNKKRLSEKAAFSFDKKHLLLILEA